MSAQDTLVKPLVARAYDQKILRWWAMSATFNRSMKAKEVLTTRGVEHFLPMRTTIGVQRGKKVRKKVPAVTNLIFVRTTEHCIQGLKDELKYLQFLCRKEDGKCRRIIVADDQMEHFMRVAGSAADDHIFLNPDEIDLSRGDKVRIHGGPFDGVEGTFVKVQGKRRRMVVVSIPTLTSVATLEFEPDLLEPIKD
ncbi:MAG: UpxY family transcription antiterminator [Alloprevotella sp.]|nr:UpxY family transcription antiterminator [Alloprevotella sp.]